MIIDANAHISEDGKWFNTSLQAGPDALLSQMDAAGVDKALLVPFHGVISNSYVTKVAATHPDRFIPACSVNPVLQSNTELKAELGMLAQNGVRICKLHNRLHKYDPANSLVYDFLELNQSLEKPMVISVCGIIYDKNVAPSLPPAHHFHKLTSTFPNTVFIIMHAAGTYALGLYEAVKDNPNVYLDLSFTISKYKGSSVDTDLKYLIENFDRKLIWGSDFPEFSEERALTDFNLLADGASNQKKQNILSANLLSILT